MKLTTALKLATVVLGTLPATLTALESAAAQDDPTAGRNRGYQSCKAFSKRVLAAGIQQSDGNRAKIDAAYRHYFGNIERCKARHLR